MNLLTDSDPAYPELAAPGVRLRGFREDDLPYLQAFAVRPVQWRYLPGPEVTPPLVEAFLLARLAAQAEAAEGLVEGLAGGAAQAEWHFCVEAEALSLPVGTARLGISSREHRQGTLAVSIDSGHWRKGYGGAALAALCRAGFEDLGLHRLSALADVQNTAALRLLEAGGFGREGVLRGNFLVRGAWRDTALYARLNPDPEI